MDLSATLSVPVFSVQADPNLLSSQLRSPNGHTIDAVANNFESMFLSMMLKEMRQTLDQGGFFGDDTGDVYGGLFDLYLGQHLAQAGGIGIGAMVKHQLQSKYKT